MDNNNFNNQENIIIPRGYDIMFKKMKSQVKITCDSMFI